MALLGDLCQLPAISADGVAWRDDRLVLVARDSGSPPAWSTSGARVEGSVRLLGRSAARSVRRSASGPQVVEPQGHLELEGTIG